MSLDSVGGGGGSNTNTASSSRMKHSLSTPSGVDGSMTPHHRGSSAGVNVGGGGGGGKKLAVRVQMLDDTITMFQVQAKALGKVLFEQVCRQLNLLEADYFGLEYQEHGSQTKYWLDLEKPMNRQVGLSLVDPMVRFCVKFYTPDPSQLEEEYTRYLFCLQVKRDLATGVLQCNDSTAAMMASYIVQASCGDYVVEDYPDHSYLSSYRFVPHQDPMLQMKIMENHKKHVGQSPAEADLNLLETARRCDLYGMKMHPARNIEGVPMNLSVAHMGIAVFQGVIRINTFSWAKIRKLSFKRKKFLIKLHPEGYGVYKDMVEFVFDGRNECKNFWKKCVENHGFFRCTAVQSTPRRKARVLSRGSSFRYSGKTQKQIIEFVRDNYVKRQTFQRSQSFRQGSQHSGNRSQSHNSSNVNSSISANPLLPIDTADWDYRNQNNNSMTPSQTRRAVDALALPAGTPTGHMRSQVTAAQVETYQMKKYADDSPSAPDPQDSSRSASPGPNMWKSPRGGYVQAHAHHDTHISENSPYHGLNGLSLDRRGEMLSMTPNRYDLSLGSDKSGSLTRDMGSYDINQAEQRAKMEDSHNNNNGGTLTRSIMGTLDSTNGINTMDMKRKRWPTDKEYFMAKELLMTERTYKKDLDIINTWFREELSNEQLEAVQPLFQLYDGMVQHHSVFLRDLEHRIVLWEGRANATYANTNGSAKTEQRVGDLMLKNMVVLPMYEEYLDTHRDILQQLNDLYTTDPSFQQIYREFEQQKICYVPIFNLLMKPFQRLVHYKMLLDQLVEHYPDNNFDRTDCQGALMMLDRMVQQMEVPLTETNNFIVLCELQRDLVGIDNLVEKNRQLIRQGCLLKHSKRGLQQRMFFLFSDVLLYASKSPINPTFKVLGHIPVRSLMTENAEHNAFVIFGGQKAITVSAGTTAEKTLWLAELTHAAQEIKNRPHLQLTITGLKNCSSSEEGLDLCGLTPAQFQQQATLANKGPTSRSNTALHVCWHRGATVGLDDYLISLDNQLSGFLLRKFKNSSGWQKLWVVFTSFCLYFYKSYQDEFALASLPLLGYSVGPPSFQDSLQKEFVFKLSFKNHVYFFRAESEHTYNRWMEVLRSTTQTQDFKKISI